MSVRRAIQAGMVGVSLAALVAPSAFAETLKVIEGSTASPLTVPMNRAVVVESDQPFAELSIANPGIADISTLSDRTIYVLGKAPGRTTMTLLGQNGTLIANVDVQVSLDVAEFKERLQQIIPDEKIEVRTANDGIVLSGIVSSIARLDRALDLAERYAPGRVSNLMSVGGTQQVLLHVRFAEMQRTVTKALDSSFGFVDSGTSSGGIGGSGNLDLLTDLVNGPSLTTSRVGGLGFTFELGGIQFAAALEALETKGLIRTLSEPNLTALSGQEARFLAGGEYPIPIRQDGDVSIEYRPFGVELAFTPRVVDGDVINLALSTAVSGLDADVVVETSGGDVNAFRVRRAQTTVELHDGDSFAIAGLLDDDYFDANNQVPWLGDIPILGALFRSAEYKRKQTELVVIISAHLVSPTRGEALALPTDRVKPPSEAQLFLLGQTASDGSRATGGAAEVARQDFTGAYGYVME